MRAIFEQSLGDQMRKCSGLLWHSIDRRSRRRPSTSLRNAFHTSATHDYGDAGFIIQRHEKNDALCADRTLTATSTTRRNAHDFCTWQTDAFEGDETIRRKIGPQRKEIQWIGTSRDTGR